MSIDSCSYQLYCLNISSESETLLSVLKYSQNILYYLINKVEQFSVQKSTFHNY